MGTLTYDLAELILTFEILAWLYLVNHEQKEVDAGRVIGWGCRCAGSCCYVDLTFDLPIVTLIFKILCRQYLRNRKV